MGSFMSLNGLKISEMTYTTLEDAIADNAQLPLSVDISGIKTNRRISVDALRGHQGVQGVQGNQGNQGTAGANGAQGNQGNQGHQGHQGHQGVQGVQGNQGVQGVQGERGSSGSQGTPNRIAYYDENGNITTSDNLKYFLDDRLLMGRVETSRSRTYGIGTSIYMHATASYAFGDSITLGTQGDSSGASCFGFGRDLKVASPDGIAVGFKVNVGQQSGYAGDSIGFGSKIYINGSESMAVGRNITALGSDTVYMGIGLQDTSTKSRRIVVSGVNMVEPSSIFPSAVYIAGCDINANEFYDHVGSQPYDQWGAVFGSTSTYIGFIGRYMDYKFKTGRPGSFMGFDSAGWPVVSNTIIPTVTTTSETSYDIIPSDSRVILSGGTTCAITANAIETPLLYKNYEVLIANKNSGDATFAGVAILPNTSCIFSYTGTSNNWILLARFANV